MDAMDLEANGRSERPDDDAPDAASDLMGITARAGLVHLLHRYSARALGASLIEVHELAYFLQEAGEPLRLNFAKARYGPYADNLRHTLIELEGHQLTGFGDGSQHIRDAEPIEVLPGAEDQAIRHLKSAPDTVARIERVLDLAAGFESMYGMELLASVHWVAREDPEAARDPAHAADLVGQWTPRKKDLFTRAHVDAAWSALDSKGWLTTARAGSTATNS